MRANFQRRSRAIRYPDYLLQAPLGAATADKTILRLEKLYLVVTTAPVVLLLIWEHAYLKGRQTMVVQISVNRKK